MARCQWHYVRVLTFSKVFLCLLPFLEYWQEPPVTMGCVGGGYSKKPLLWTRICPIQNLQERDISRVMQRDCMSQSHEKAGGLLVYRRRETNLSDDTLRRRRRLSSHLWGSARTSGKVKRLSTLLGANESNRMWPRSALRAGQMLCF
jgi:hypothetical protein